MGFANPFQIYFFIWFFLILGYYFSRDSFIQVAPEYLLLILTAKAVALTLVVGVYLSISRAAEFKGFEGVLRPRVGRIWLAQILVLLAIPLVYQRAVSLAGGDDIFSVIGYIKLRSAMTDDGESFGVLSYFSVLSVVVTSILVNSYAERKIHLLRMIASILISLFYAYISTARTYVLFLFLLLIFPLVLAGVIRFKGILIALFFMVCAFIFVAMMTAKGVSVEADAADNASSFAENLRAYTVAPFLAFSRLVSNPPAAEWGLNTFRLVTTVLNALGVTDRAPPALIRSYEFVPDATNVYTVYETYFRDFLFLGVFIPPLFLIGHWWLYKKAKKSGGKWVYYYSASMYPLVMQFFQDQYFSLLAMWIQIGFWYWLLLSPQLRLEKDVARD
ncbi:oligosaccharide repeat unit polymerase [Variovorax paradoxus]|nr:oligosaccharide repeat unit polymerase [Variovorax paradoxus]